MLERRNILAWALVAVFFAECDEDDEDRDRPVDVGDEDGVDRTETGYPYRTDDRRKKRRA